MCPIKPWHWMFGVMGDGQNCQPKWGPDAAKPKYAALAAANQNACVRFSTWCYRLPGKYVLDNTDSKTAAPLMADIIDMAAEVGLKFEMHGDLQPAQYLIYVEMDADGRCLVEGDTQIILRRGIFDFYKAGFEYDRDNFRMVHVSAPSNIDDLILEAVRDCQDIKVITFFSACARCIEGGCNAITSESQSANTTM